MNVRAFCQLAWLGLSALALPPGQAALAAERGSAVEVVGLRMAGPDLEVHVAGPVSRRPVVAVLSEAGGRGSASAVVKQGRARIAGALPSFTRFGPVWRISLTDAAGVPFGAAFPFLVALDCPAAGEACRFQLLPGLAAPGTALVDPALGRVLDGLPEGTGDLLAVAATDPAQRGAALTAAWHWAALPAPPAGGCGCAWTLEAALPGDTAEGGVAAGVGGWSVRREPGLRVERTRESALRLRQRCVRTRLLAAERVAVQEGAWSASLAIPRVVLSACPAACAPEVSWEARIEGRAAAWVGDEGEASAEAAAEAGWEVFVTVDGRVVQRAGDAAAGAPGEERNAAAQDVSASGKGEALTLSATAQAEAGVPGEKAGDAVALAAVAWNLTGRGTSSCAAPVRVNVTSSAKLGWQGGLEGRPCDPGQIGLITGSEDCPGRGK